MRKLDKEGVERLQTIKAMKKAGAPEVSFMVNFMIEYIDPKGNCCSTCSSQIRYFHQRILEWGQSHQGEIDEILAAKEATEEHQTEITTETTPQPKKVGRKKKT